MAKSSEFARSGIKTKIIASSDLSRSIAAESVKRIRDSSFKEIAKIYIICIFFANILILNFACNSSEWGLLFRLEQMKPVGRLGEASEIAHTAKYIFENDFFTGRVVEIDGGISM
ncbi:hypothetical protein WG68_11195 [Arsukibacterium ikkense]|uniref:Uncharacterized protein n=1 Tax=Arsukibacterium ikkense TaxID=336831 RepID=A0A0M2V359_9GAMM|nr:hypothetical protein WG68_11195 [Arsukibacterium ikkense]